MFLKGGLCPPIDPQETTYCVVASHRKNYTSLCAAQYDVRSIRSEKQLRFNSDEDQSNETDRSKPSSVNNNITKNNKIDVDADGFNIFEENFKSVYRRKKFGRSTKVSNEDPVVACVGERTHHLIENLDPSTTYFVSVFGVAKDRRAGSLLAIGNVKPRTSTAKRLRENVPYKADIKGKNVYYLKTSSGGSGLWLVVSTCGGTVDIEVSVRGKRLYVAKNIESHQKFYVPPPIISSSIQETSDEGSVQFDSSSEESKIRYVMRVLPNKWNRDDAVTLEVVLIASLAVVAFASEEKGTQKAAAEEKKQDKRGIYDTGSYGGSYESGDGGHSFGGGVGGHSFGGGDGGHSFGGGDGGHSFGGSDGGHGYGGDLSGHEASFSQGGHEGYGHAGAEFGGISGDSWKPISSDHGHHHVKTIEVIKKVPVPYTVEKHVPYTVEKKVPYEVKVPYPQPYTVEKKVPVTVKEYVKYPVHVPEPYVVEKKVPYEVKVPVDKPFEVKVKVPTPYTVEKKVPYEVKVPVPQPYTVEKKVPYPVKYEVKVPQPYEVVKKVPYEVKVPVDKPYHVYVPKPYPVPVEKPYPVTVHKPVPYEVKVPVDKPYKVEVEKPYPVPVKVPIPKPYDVYKKIPYTVEKKVPYEVKVPIDKPYPVFKEVQVPLLREVPYPVKVHVPVYIKKEEEHHGWH